MMVAVRMPGRLVVTWLPVPIEPWAAVAPRNVAPSATRPTAIRVTERARLGKLDILEVSSFWDQGPIDLLNCRPTGRARTSRRRSPTVPKTGFRTKVAPSKKSGRPKPPALPIDADCLLADA